MAAKKKSNKFGHFIAFLIFLALGVSAGYVGATKFFNNDPIDSPSSTKNDYPKDITKSNEFKDEVEQFSDFLINHVYLYNSKGANVDTLDNSIKLRLAYEYVANNNLFDTETVDATWFGSISCNYDFLVDTAEDGISNANYCTLKVISKGNLLKGLNKYFKTDVVEYPSEFIPANGVKCLLLEDDNYRCGKVFDNEGAVTGDVVSRFDIVKVTIEEDNTINVYDKGYLIDNRSTAIKNENYEKVYIHSYDSTNYYYELKSSDNLTFKHVFKLDDNGNYYYYSSSVV